MSLVQRFLKQKVFLLVVLMAAAAGALAACSGEDNGGGGDETPIVNVALQEWSVTLDRDTVPAGPVKFVVKNAGKQEHELIVMKTDLGPKGLKVAGGKVDEAASGKGYGEIEEEDLGVGKSESATFKLDAGNYVLFCNLGGHYQAGMAAALTVTAGKTTSTDKSLVVYSGRTQNLVQPVIDQFTKETGIKVEVKYASTAAIAATILEEGKNSPADVVYLQDAGGMGAIQKRDMLAVLPDATLQKVDPRYRSKKSEWVGVTGRVRVVVYNPNKVNPERDFPKSILGFTDPKWKGRIGWAPSNASLQAFITALRVQYGEAEAEKWVRGIVANNPKEYGSNAPVVEAVANGEVDIGFVNHYYLFPFLQERGQSFAARNYYYHDDLGGLMNVGPVGILKTAKHKDAAQRFVDYLLSKEAQTHFAKETFEFPLVSGVVAPEGVPSLSALNPPAFDLSNLDDLQGTLTLMRKAGALS